MKDSFEYKGEWFLPNSESRLNGCLSYDPKTGSCLELYGSFNSLFDYTSREIILGDTNMGRITIVDAHFRGNKTTLNGPELATYLPAYIFVGDHFESKSEIEFEEMFAKVFNQFDWYGLSGLTKKLDYKNRTYSLDYRRLEAIEFEISDEFNGKISLDSSIDFSTNNSAINIEEACYLTLEYKEKKQFGEILTDLTKYVQFISIMSFEQSFSESIVFVQKQVEDSKKRLVKCIFTNSNFTRKVKARLNFEFIVNYEDVNENFQNVISLWYDAYNRFEPAILLLQKTLEHTNQFSRDKFMDAVRALESFHRDIYKSTRIPQDDFDQLVSNILNNVNLSENHFKWLKYRLMGNEPSLNTRIKELLKNCPNSFVNKHIANSNKFSRKITDSRNYLTHFDKSKKTRVTKNLDLVRDTLTLQGILYCCILGELKIPYEKFEKRLNYYLQ